MFSNMQQQTNVPVPPGHPIQMAPRPQPIPGVPVGLEYLTQLDSFVVEQKKSLMEAFTGWEVRNKYVVKNVAGQQFYFAAEESSTCMRLCCGSGRGFTFHILDNTNEEIMRFTREFKCCAGCCWCAGCISGCSFEIKVEAPVGTVIGYVKQGGSFWKANYEILDELHEPVLKMRGPCCTWNGPCCPCESDFDLLTRDESNQIGKVSRKYGGFIQEAFTKADNYSAEFPMDLSAKAKACVLASVLMIDFMYYESDEDNNGLAF